MKKVLKRFTWFIEDTLIYAVGNIMYYTFTNKAERKYHKTLRNGEGGW